MISGVMHETNEEFTENMHRYFVEREHIVSAYEGETILQRNRRFETSACYHGNEIETTLQTLRIEMLQLMQCDVQLWKQLTKLYVSIEELKENINQGSLVPDNPVSNLQGSVSTVTSDTDSFVSAEEYNELTAHDRVKSWIKECRSYENVTVDDPDCQERTCYRPRSRSCDIVATCRTYRPRENAYTASEDNVINTLNGTKFNFWGFGSNFHPDYLINDELDNRLTALFRKAQTMKTFEETEVVSERNFTSYKSSLRLLGSVRMRSRIFEPSLTKWRPFSISHSSDSFIIVPRAAFPKIQPRPKLRRSCNVFESDRISTPVSVNENDDVFETSLHDPDIANTEQQDDQLIATDSYNKIDDEHNEEAAEIQTIGKKTNVPAGELVDAQTISLIFSEIGDNADIERKLKVPLDLGEIYKTDDNLIRIGGEFVENNGEVTKDGITFEIEIGSCLDLNHDAHTDLSNVSATNTDLSYLKFLDIKDGLVTCRITSPELEHDSNGGASAEPEEYNYLVFVDGRVAFKYDTDPEETYFIGWLFENNQIENEDRVEFENEESYFIHSLFCDDEKGLLDERELNKDGTFCDSHKLVKFENEEESYFIHLLFQDDEKWLLDERELNKHGTFCDSHKLDESFEEQGVVNEKEMLTEQGPSCFTSNELNQDSGKKDHSAE